MAVFLVFLLVLVIGLCLPKGPGKKAYWGAVLALLYFPIGVIMALTKRYK